MSKVRIPEPEGFEDFWNCWRPHARHTDGRGLARETFRKHVLNGALPQDIIDGAKWFIRNLSARDREYVPLSSTWLNRETWADLCERERAFQERQASVAENVVQLNREPKAPKPKFLRDWERERGQA
jgi:hypothetical protein